MKTFNVKLLYAYKFIGQCLPIYAFYTILFVERGMTVNEIALLIALWSAFAIAFEVPSGILADRWNRRNMLVISALLQGLCFIIWFFSYNFFMFALGFIFWAVSGAFVSGTEEGLIYDNLKSDGREESFSDIYGKSQFFANAGTIAGIASAGILVNFISISSIAVVSALICFVNAFISSGLREKNYYSENTKNEAGDFFKTFHEAAAFIKGNRLVFIFFIFLVFLANIGAYLDEFDALIINDFKLDNIWVSVILGLRFVFVAIGALLAPIVQKKISSIPQIFLINLAAFIFLAIFAVIWHKYAILLFSLSSMLMAVTEILSINIMQDEIDGEGRSTIMSFYSVGQNIVMIAFSLLYAVLSDIFTLRQTYGIIAVYGIIGCLAFFALQKRDSP